MIHKHAHRKLLAARPPRPPLLLDALEDRVAPSVSLVRDINLGANTGGSDPIDLCQVGSKLYFNAFDLTHGRELWVTDGTTAGTVRIADIRPGVYSSNPSHLTNVNGILFFTANDGNSGYELWRSNGTASGTFLVRDIGPATASSLPDELINDAGVLYFAANDKLHGDELWRSDGTSSGTVLIADIAESELSSYPLSLVPHPLLAGFFFAATTPDKGRELWFSDGTSIGTLLVQDIDPGPDSSSPQQITAGFNGVYFAANDGLNGSELWYSQGTAASTDLVMDILPGPISSSPSDFALGPTAMFFRASDGNIGFELWKSNASSASTLLVRDISPGGSSFPNSLTFVGTTLYFSANGSAATGSELWKSDGSSTGTTLVEDIYGGPTASNPLSLTNVGGTLFFEANTAAQGQELWKSDGTLAGTQLVLDINAGSLGSNLNFFTNFNNTLYFTANDGKNDFELWKSAGAASNTAIVHDQFTANLSGNIEQQVEFNGQLFFCANSSAGGIELWRSDGTSTGTQVVHEINPGPASADITSLAVVGSFLYFNANDGVNGTELWRTDGTSTGTAPVADIAPGALSSEPFGLTNVSGTLYFVANDGTNGYALWKHTAAGTALVRDMDPATTPANFPSLLTNINGTLYFRANDGFTGRELWKSNGTSASTVLVRDIQPGSGHGFPSSLMEYNGKVVFQANDSVNGTELWISDGTSAGTTLLADINAGAESSSPSGFVEFSDTLYFVADDGTHGSELWATDGMSTGTRIIRDILPGLASSSPSTLVQLNGALAFEARDDTFGSELWTSDGTSAGTKLLRDIESGSDSSFPTWITVINGLLYTSAVTAAKGGEIWRSDGTSAGTVFLEEVIPGSGDSSASSFIEAGGVLYFEARDDTRGTELWRLDGGLPPTITSNGGGGTASFDVVENTLTATTVTATDPNPGALTFSISGGHDAADFSINSATGALTFAATPNFEAPTDSGANNVYQVTVRVSDGVLVDQQTLNITVVDDAHDQAIVYVDAALAGKADGTVFADIDPFTAGNQPATVGVNAFATLERGIDAVVGKVTMLPGTYTDPANLIVPFSLHTPSGTVTISGVLSGGSGLRKIGTGTLSLTSFNTFTGGIAIDRGTLSVAATGAFGDLANEVIVAALGTVRITGSFTTARSFGLNGGTVLLDPGVTLTLNTGGITGGFLAGSGMLRTAPTSFGMLHGVTVAASVNLDSQGNDSFELVELHGTLTTASGKAVTLDGLTIEAAGRATLNGTANVSNFSSIGQMTVAGTLSNISGLATFGGGSVTTINPGAILDVGAAGVRVAGGLVKNSGDFSGGGTITVDFNGRVQGTGIFGSIVTQNGGVFAPGASPGTATTHQLNLNRSGRLEFEVANASGTPGIVSGWDLINVQPTVFSPTGLMNYTGTPTDKYIIQLKSRLDDGIGNTPGPVANFNSALPYAWKFADGSNALTGSSGTFNASNFQIDTTGFSNTFTGGFGVELRDGGKNLYVVYTPVAGPTVNNFIVNGGATQRSRLTTIHVNFATPTDAAAFQTTGAITLTRTAATASGSFGTLVNTSNGLIVSPASGMVFSVMLTFANTNTTGINSGSLADGRWRLAIPSAGFQSVLNDPVLRRLYGDDNNDGTVDGNDLAAFGAAFGSTGTSPFDFNADGTVDALDFGEFGNRFGISL